MEAQSSRSELDVEYFRQRLMSEQDRIRRLLGAVTGSLLAPDELEQSQRVSLREQLQRVTQALQRVQNNAYGVCVRCSRPISRSRLEARPYAAYCLECTLHRTDS